MCTGRLLRKRDKWEMEKNWFRVMYHQETQNSIGQTKCSCSLYGTNNQQYPAVDFRLVTQLEQSQ